MKPSVNWLPALIPVTLALEHGGAPAPWVFFIAAIAILPVARLGSLFMAVLIGAHVAGNGRANWFKGVQLVTVYLIIALMFYLLPTAS